LYLRNLSGKKNLEKPSQKLSCTFFKTLKKKTSQKPKWEEKLGKPSQKLQETLKKNFLVRQET
jgi:hypothetical protein